MLSSIVATSLALNALSLEEKVGQLLVVHFNGAECNDDAKILIDQAHVSGFIYYNWANQLDDKERVTKLSASLQAYSPIPLIITTDQEGGRISRLKEGFPALPSAIDLSEKIPFEEISLKVCEMGRAIKEAGINLNLAPVVDVRNNPNNPVITDRSYGDTPEKVVRFAREVLRGYSESGLMTTLKHFPGHGDVTVDSHLDLPVIEKSLDELNSMELKPFQELSCMASAILTGHLFVPALDPKEPITFSKKAIDYLRNEMHFDGLVMTDSLAMEGILKQVDSVEEAAFRAFKAGYDILLLGGKQLIGANDGFEITPQDVIRVHRYLVEMIENDPLLEMQLEESLARIERIKSHL